MNAAAPHPFCAAAHCQRDRCASRCAAPGCAAGGQACARPAQTHRPSRVEHIARDVLCSRAGAWRKLAATFREVVLVPGMRIAVHGVALIEEDEHAERGYRDSAPRRTRIVSPGGAPIAIGDPPPP